MAQESDGRTDTQELEARLREQLEQLKVAGLRGVWAGDLINKPATRDLVRLGLADNTGGPPSSLSRVYITAKGREALK